MRAPTRWRALRAEIHADICAHGFDAALGSFVQSYGSTELDASLLQMPIVGFLPADDPRVVGTVAAIERDLMADGFVLRYRSETAPDGLPGGEGAFLACSFWLVDAYVLQPLEEARALFERLVALCNDVGLFCEEYDPHRPAARQLSPGLHPRGLDQQRLDLTKADRPADQRAEPESVLGVGSAPDSSLVLI